MLNGPARNDHVGEQCGIVERHAGRRVHDDLVDQKQQADRRHQRRERIGERDELEPDEIDQRADAAARDGRKDEHDDRGRLEAGEHEQARIGGADRSRRIGQVDLVHDAEDQREADAEQRVGCAEQHAVDDRLNGVDQVKMSTTAVRRYIGVWMERRRRAEPGPPPAQFDVVRRQDDGLCRTSQLPPLACT